MDTGFSHGINVAFWAYSCPEQHPPLKTPPCASWLDHINSQLETSSGFFPSSSEIPSMDVLNITSDCYRPTDHWDSHQGVWANCWKMQIIHAEMGLYLLNGQRADHAYADPHSHLVPFTWLCHFIHHQLSEMHLLMLYICITWCSFTTPLHTTSVNSSSPADCQNINSPEFVCSSVYLPLVSREEKKANLL